MSFLGRPSAAEVVRDHGPQVYRQLCRIFGPRADVDDLFQMVFIEVLRSLPRLRSRHALGAWIRRITWNVAYQEMRSQYRRPQESELDETRLAPNDDAEELVERRQAMSKLYACLDRLSAKQRMAVILHDVEGCTLKEMGRILGRPLQTVASQLHSGRAQLAHLMAETTPQAVGQVAGKVKR